MITTTNNIKDKKPSRLMLLPMGILETLPCVKDVDYITRDLAVSSVRIPNPKNNSHPRDISIHQNLLQAEKPQQQSTIVSL
ncbi:hypothetical protein Tco_0808708 [Tanacetum coccineum]